MLCFTPELNRHNSAQEDPVSTPILQMRELAKRFNNSPKLTHYQWVPAPAGGLPSAHSHTTPGFVSVSLHWGCSGPQTPSEARSLVSNPR